MSKSFKSTPICTIHRCKGQKNDKRLASRRFRRKERMAVATAQYDNAPINKFEIADPWTFVGDGKSYNSNLPNKYMRK